jgi:hypothetical protein
MRWPSALLVPGPAISRVGWCSASSLYDPSRPPELDEAVVLMERYADAPMDFADATLVLLAEGLSVHEILTLDRGGFTIYRTRQRKALRMVLDKS